jgi:hypothetical protein
LHVLVLETIVLRIVGCRRGVVFIGHLDHFQAVRARCFTLLRSGGFVFRRAHVGT